MPSSMPRTDPQCAPELYYITTKTKDEARLIARALLQDKLIAGANIFPLDSLYWWQEKICEETEFALFMQSTKENFARIEEVVKTLHSYEIPCILSFAVSQGSSDFLHWIGENTKNSDTK